MLSWMSFRWVILCWTVNIFICTSIKSTYIYERVLCRLLFLHHLYAIWWSLDFAHVFARLKSWEWIFIHGDCVCYNCIVHFLTISFLHDVQLLATQENGSWLLSHICLLYTNLIWIIMHAHVRDLLSWATPDNETDTTLSGHLWGCLLLRLIELGLRNSGRYLQKIL